MSLGSDGGVPAVMNVTPTGTSSNGNCGGGFGWGGDWMAFIVLFLLFGMFGWGGFGGGNGAAFQGALTRGELCQDMNFQSLENATRGIQQGLCDGFYAVNTSLLNGFHGVDNAVCTLGYQTQQGINSVNMGMMQGFNAANVVALQNQNALQAQLADCCCGINRAIDGVNYNMATNTCALQNTMNNNTRDIIDNQNAGTRAILDYLCKDKIDTLQSENQALRLAASQANQNNVIGARIDAATAEILRKTGSECPLPAYIVQPPQPVSFATNCSGQATFNNGYGYGNCGCNSGCCGCNG